MISHAMCNANELIDLFYNKILFAIEKSSNLIKINFKNKRIMEWIIKDLSTSAQSKNKLSKKIIKHLNNTKQWNYYNKYRNKFTLLIRAAKIELSNKVIIIMIIK